MPVVLSRVEVAQLLQTIDALDTRDPYGTLARLMYGAGLRLMEACRLRVKDVGSAAEPTDRSSSQGRQESASDVADRAA